MNVIIINIGDELLIGQILNTNATWMAEELTKNGMHVKSTTVISDDKDQILNTLQLALKEAEIILITGGLGPTKDDITKKTLTQFFNSELIEDPRSLENLERIFLKRGYPLTPTNREQALVPACCEPIINPLGTAPTMWFEKDNKIVISMPGVPFEMKTTMTNEVIPRLKSRFQLPAILHKTILTSGIGESFLSDLIESWELALPSHLSLAYLPNVGMVLLRLSGQGQNMEELESQMQKELEKLMLIAGKYIISYEYDSAEKVIFSLLSSQNSTLSVAESCTGGNISHCLTSLPGSSSFFKGGVIAYTNTIKEKILYVSRETIDTYHVVSEETAREMALGVRKAFDTTYSIATTGIAGPGGGSDEKPVGTVCVAIADKNRVASKTFVFSSDRDRNIQRATNAALVELFLFITIKE